MTADEQRIVDAYFEAVSILASVIGTPPDIDDPEIPPSVNTDRIPATVLDAGYTAIRFLAVGHGIAEGAELHGPGLSADEFLTQLSEGS